jgi:hypothetical protein
LYEISLLGQLHLLIAQKILVGIVECANFAGRREEKRNPGSWSMQRISQGEVIETHVQRYVLYCQLLTSHSNSLFLFLFYFYVILRLHPVEADWNSILAHEFNSLDTQESP